MNVASKVEWPDAPDGELETIYQALFDPQTGGGLLFGVAQEKLADTLQFLQDRGFESATEIGTVSQADGRPRISFVWYIAF